MTPIRASCLGRGPQGTASKPKPKGCLSFKKSVQDDERVVLWKETRQNSIRYLCTMYAQTREKKKKMRKRHRDREEESLLLGRRDVVRATSQRCARAWEGAAEVSSPRARVPVSSDARVSLPILPPSHAVCLALPFLSLTTFVNTGFFFSYQ